MIIVVCSSFGRCRLNSILINRQLLDSTVSGLRRGENDSRVGVGRSYAKIPFVTQVSEARGQLEVPVRSASARSTRPSSSRCILLLLP